jgi:1-acyl-sn-glycerol-3-phosphate acyltransferase
VAYKDRGYFLFANHTQPIADAFSPNILTFPKHNSLIINKDNLALPVLGGALPYLGGIPLPDSVGAAKSFLECIKSRLDRGEAITVFPEAHVWSYYTGIRALNDAAFDLPVRFSAPVFAVTRVYRKGLFGVRCFIFIDGPFQPDQSLPKKEARKRLCRHVEAQMRERAALSNVEVIKYLPKNKEG